MSDTDRPTLTDTERVIVRFFEILAAIDAGLESLTRVSEYQNPGGDFLNAEYVTGSGWRFEVFPDGGMFDYFNWFQTPDGVRYAVQWPSNHDGCPVVELALWRLLQSYGPLNRAVWEVATYGREVTVWGTP